jgi:hypothetical protein
MPFLRELNMKANRIRKLVSALSRIILLITVFISSDDVLTLLCCADMIPHVLAG